MTYEQLAILAIPAMCLMWAVIIAVGVWRAYERLCDEVDEMRGLK